MTRALTYLLVTFMICPGYYLQSTRSRIMYGQKPILRLGPEKSKTETNSEHSVPGWLAVMKARLAEAEDMMRGRHQHAPDTGDDDDDDDDDDQEYHDVAVQPVPKWEQDLKSYLKEIISTFDKSHTDNYLRPAVKTIEKQQKVVIKDIDVNSRGEISITYDHAPNNKLRKKPRKHKTQNINDY